MNEWKLNNILEKRLLLYKWSLVFLLQLNPHWLARALLTNANLHETAISKELSNFDYQQVIKGPTKTTSSSIMLIDLTSTNRPEWINKDCNLVAGPSDHNKLEQYKNFSWLTNSQNAIKEINWYDLFVHKSMDDITVEYSILYIIYSIVGL